MRVKRNDGRKISTSKWVKSQQICIDDILIENLFNSEPSIKLIIHMTKYIKSGKFCNELKISIAKFLLRIMID